MIVVVPVSHGVVQPYGARSWQLHVIRTPTGPVQILGAATSPPFAARSCWHAVHVLVPMAIVRRVWRLAAPAVATLMPALAASSNHGGIAMLVAVVPCSSEDECWMRAFY